jgi:manganese-dependent inorganic pyrophosphatase
MQTIVIGHKNPDMDSICSAAGYARLKQLTGMPDVIAGRAGNINERVQYVLDRFRVEAPQFFSDVSPRIADVMQTEVITAHADAPIYDAIQLIEQGRFRGLPVVDDANRCLGLLSAWRMTQYLFPPREQTTATRTVLSSLKRMVQTFGGKCIAGDLDDREEELRLLVAAMRTDSVAERLRRYDPKHLVLLVGDREEVQKLAIDAGVKAVIVTADAPVSAEVARRAADAGVVLTTSSHDTATTVLLVRGAVRAGQMIDAEFESLSAEMTLDAVRTTVAGSHSFVFPVLDEKGVLVGIVSKSDFLKPVPRRLILVDHNEISQAVAGADKIPIIEILDHHRLGGISSSSPILFWNNPVGSTSTIVALCYRQAGVPVPKDIAGLLMAGLISDTLNLTSPTATHVDSEILKELSEIVEIPPHKLAEDIFSVGSPLLTLSPQQAISADCKEYEEMGMRFSVAQIEELSFAHLPEKQDALAAALREYCRAARLGFAALLVTDITSQTSILMLEGSEEFARQIDYPPAGPNRWELAGVVSRKKQLLPYLLQRLAVMQPGRG